MKKCPCKHFHILITYLKKMAYTCVRPAYFNDEKKLLISLLSLLHLMNGASQIFKGEPIVF